MRIETEETCEVCLSNIVIHTAKKTPAQCLARTLPAWRKCRCGWLEIATSTLVELAPDWKATLDPDPEEELNV